MALQILLKRNFKHVVTVHDSKGTTEEVQTDAPIDPQSIINGLADLNSHGVIVWNIKAGVSTLDGNTKITNIDSFGLINKDGTWAHEPSGYDDLIDDPPVPFKTDAWVLGEYLVRLKTGKGIPRRFLKSQALLDKFTKDDEILRKLLILDKEKRYNIWDVVPSNPSNDCIIS